LNKIAVSVQNPLPGWILIQEAVAILLQSYFSEMEGEKWPARLFPTLSYNTRTGTEISTNKNYVSIENRDMKVRLTGDV
jgi:hypothetical protein